MKPIIFNTEMVRAILDGRKTVTRRVMKQYAPEDTKFGYTAFTPDGCISARGTYVDGWGEKFYRLPYLQGDILYVRETCAQISDWTTVDPEVGLFDGYIYKADWAEDEHPRWRPSIHMPREAARIFLRVTNVRVERLQEITMSGMLGEGVIPQNVTGGQWKQWQNDYMRPVWDSTIKPAGLALYGWDADPWVWVIEFEQITKDEAFHQN